MENYSHKKRWEAITSILPQGNLTPTANDGIRRCFECQPKTHIFSACSILGRDVRGQGRGSERDKGRGCHFTRMSAWRYIAPKTDGATKTVNSVVWSWCKHCKCRATGKVGFFTKHSLSRHTFPRRTATVTETTPQEEYTALRSRL